MNENLAPEMRRIAYFSMEIALESSMATYSGGLGVLAGDSLRAAADLSLPVVGVTLLCRKGYLHQSLTTRGLQREKADLWPVDDHLTLLPQRATIELEGRTVHLQPWLYEITGATGFVIPVCFLDTDLPDNDPQDREFSQNLYGGDDRYRLCQEAILGIGGVRMLRALGYHRIKRFHMNEGHSSLMTLELAEEHLRQHEGPPDLHTIDHVRRQCVFTTHTPVPAGHDQFPMEMVHAVLGHRKLLEEESLKRIVCMDGTVNLTHLALNLSRYINGVAKKHGEISRLMFPGHQIDSITNGIHCTTWASERMQMLFDEYVPDWREDSAGLRNVLRVPLNSIWDTHQTAKIELVDFTNHETGAGFDKDHFTIGFARRFTAYKRPALLFSDVRKLAELAGEIGPIQIVYGGKAHPKDTEGKKLIRTIFQTACSLPDNIRFAYIPNYDVSLGRRLVAGVDLWLNTPRPPMEASGTSGMKAALNGVPSLSTLDGWWIEGHIEGVTGWAIEVEKGKEDDDALAAASLYAKLEKILALYYRNRRRYTEIMRFAIALNASVFNAQRMMQQYVVRAYR